MNISATIHKKAQILFRQRIESANAFWNNASEEEAQRLIGTSRLIDGDSKFAEKLVELRKHNDAILYNLYKHYENSTKKRNYYKNGIINRKLIKDEEGKTLTKKIAIFLPHVAWTGGMKMIFTLGDILKDKGYYIDYFVPYTSTGETLNLEVGPISVEAITYEDDSAIQSFSSNYDLAIATYWDLIFPLYRNFKKTVHFGQGDYNTFSNKPDKIKMLQLFYSLPVHHMGVSSFLTDIM
ncbi:hypothetical protein P4575_27835, partial [Priestia megaterium]|uniref:hypothetical protein n=1 Tax=Priestia megaterium TaxID=1404 RepID=UPI002E1B2EFC|nr:hypothetical protein [Priestia megaterium]